MYWPGQSRIGTYLIAKRRRKGRGNKNTKHLRHGGARTIVADSLLMMQLDYQFVYGLQAVQ